MHVLFLLATFQLASCSWWGYLSSQSPNEETTDTAEPRELDEGDFELIGVDDLLERSMCLSQMPDKSFKCHSGGEPLPGAFTAPLATPFRRDSARQSSSPAVSGENFLDDNVSLEGIEKLISSESFSASGNLKKSLENIKKKFTPEVATPMLEMPGFMAEVAVFMIEVAESASGLGGSTSGLSGSMSGLGGSASRLGEPMSGLGGFVPQVVVSMPEMSEPAPSATLTTPKTSEFMSEMTGSTLLKAESIPEVTEPTPQMRNLLFEEIDFSKFKVTEFIPDMTGFSSEAAPFSPEVTDFIPEMIESSPAVTEFAPDMAELMSELGCEFTPEVTELGSKFTPEVTELGSKFTPKVTESTPKFVPEVTEFTPQFTPGSTPEVTSESTPNVTLESKRDPNNSDLLDFNHLPLESKTTPPFSAIILTTDAPKPCSSAGQMDAQYTNLPAKTPPAAGDKFSPSANCLASIEEMLKMTGGAIITSTPHLIRHKNGVSEEEDDTHLVITDQNETFHMETTSSHIKDDVSPIEKLVAPREDIALVDEVEWDDYVVSSPPKTANPVHKTPTSLDNKHMRQRASPSPNPADSKKSLLTKRRTNPTANRSDSRDDQSLLGRWERFSIKDEITSFFTNQDEESTPNSERRSMTSTPKPNPERKPMASLSSPGRPSSDASNNPNPSTSNQTDEKQTPAFFNVLW